MLILDLEFKKGRVDATESKALTITQSILVGPRIERKNYIRNYCVTKTISVIKCKVNKHHF